MADEHLLEVRPLDEGKLITDVIALLERDRLVQVERLEHLPDGFLVVAGHLLCGTHEHEQPSQPRTG